MNSLEIPIVILAAGKSRRMRGADKLLQDVNGMTLLKHQVDKAQRAKAGAVYVVLPPAPNPRHAALKGCDFQLVLSVDTHMGMSASLRSGLEALPAETEAAMILLADLPDLTTADLIKVCSNVGLDDGTLIWRGTTSDGAPGHPVVFAASLFPELKALSGDSGGAEVIAAHKNNTKLVALPDMHARRDLDTPEDWAAWRQDQNG